MRARGAAQAAERNGDRALDTPGTCMQKCRRTYQDSAARAHARTGGARVAEVTRVSTQANEWTHTRANETANGRADDWAAASFTVETEGNFLWLGLEQSNIVAVHTVLVRV